MTLQAGLEKSLFLLPNRAGLSMLMSSWLSVDYQCALSLVYLITDINTDLPRFADFYENISRFCIWSRNIWCLL